MESKIVIMERLCEEFKIPLHVAFDSRTDWESLIAHGDLILAAIFKAEMAKRGWFPRYTSKTVYLVREYAQRRKCTTQVELNKASSSSEAEAIIRVCDEALAL